MWNYTNETIHPSSSKNFMADDTVFIQDEITSENCAYLIADMMRYVMAPESSGKELKIVINTPGGEVSVMNQICGIISMAKINNIAVITYVMGVAASAGSVIAIHGDQRIMAKNAEHLIHYGYCLEAISKQTEIAKTFAYNMDFSKRMAQIYLDHCPGLTPEKLKILQEDEKGRLFADECLKLGICDTIIETELDKKIEKENWQIDVLTNAMAEEKKSSKKIKKKA
jgi:ATP-dependent protease ClpP protease subunit